MTTPKQDLTATPSGSVEGVDVETPNEQAARELLEQARSVRHGDCSCSRCVLKWIDQRHAEAIKRTLQGEAHWHEQFKRMEQERDEATRGCESYQAAHQVACKEIDRLSLEVGRLKLALTPFADEADKAEQQYANAFNDIAPASLKANVTIGQCRAARRALTGGAEK